MYSYEVRIRAVELYIKLGRRVRPTIWQLGCRRLLASARQYSTISEKVVQRLMKQKEPGRSQAQAAAVRLLPGEIGAAPENLINRDFRAAAPNEKWLTDITEF